MNYGLLTIYLLYTLSLGFILALHGKERRDDDGNVHKYNIWTALISTTIMLVLTWWATGWRFL